jgi:hypothetical protein
MRTALAAGGALAVGAAVAVALAGKGSQFTAALHAAPLWILGLAAGLQFAALVARTEAWNVCVHAAGGTVARRRLYRASSVGYVAMLANGQLGVAARIAALRRVAPDGSPRIPALLAAEVPILATEATLAAVWSFTLVGPLGLAWWIPLIAFAVMAALSVGLCAVARRRRCGLWSGLAVLRTLDGRSRVVALVSLLDSIAVLIAMVAIGQLPLGPGVGAAATVLILGTHGVATVAAAGVLLTATGTAGALCFATWALLDWLWTRERRSSARSPAAALRIALAGAPAP